jgi:hypothetical protein
MAGRTLLPPIVTALLLLLTACRQEQLSLPVTHAASAGPQSAMELSLHPVSSEPAPGESCYSFILLRPRDQRAVAVQARLTQADKMAAALDSRTFSVDIVGDHANILSLQYPVQWPAPRAYTDQVSAVVEDYFASADVEDYMCISGFAEVRLSAKGVNDHRIHPLWTARVTSEGLLKVAIDGQQLATVDPVSLQ